jgi:DNA-binding transcriptional MerR regulator
MRRQLDSLRDQKYVGVAELADQAARILGRAAPQQERGTVSEVPDERTVRYYLTEGLLSPAEDRQGTASVFGYRHLLQLLVIKKLQAEHLPIRKIRDLVSDRKERELERLLGVEEGGGPKAKNEAMRYLESLLTAPSRPLPAERSLLRRAEKSPPPAPPLPLFAPPPAGAPGAAAARPRAGATGSWERLELEPGLELHVHSGYRVPGEARGMRRLARLILQAVASIGRRPGK